MKKKTIYIIITILVLFIIASLLVQGFMAGIKNTPRNNTLQMTHHFIR